MAIWLGQGGGLRLKRKADSSFYAHVGVSDVDVGANRLSAEQAVGALITGDHVAVFHVDENGAPLLSPLPFMGGGAWPDGQQYPDGQWYVHVDAVGGVRFYESWAKAIEGKGGDALPLSTPGGPSRIRVSLVDTDERCMAQTVSWQLNTDREVADITALGEGFRQNQGVLVSGGGELDCLFDAIYTDCPDNRSEELSVYLHRLAMRQEVGSTFTGVFLLKRKGSLPITVDQMYAERELFYRCDCVITGVASEVDTEDVIHSRVTFVTTGPIQLLYSYPASYLLQEDPDTSKVLQESDFGIVLDSAQ